MPEDRIREIENHVRQIMSGENAHDFMHVDRVRNWALQIAKSEGFESLELLQAAALLHDIGRINRDPKGHAESGAEIATKFLCRGDLFTRSEIEEIANAIRRHNALNDNGRLAEILRDADILHLLGAVGIMRAFTSKHSQPEYDPHNPKTETWGYPTVASMSDWHRKLGLENILLTKSTFN